MVIIIIIIILTIIMIIITINIITIIILTFKFSVTFIVAVMRMLIECSNDFIEISSFCHPLENLGKQLFLCGTGKLFAFIFKQLKKSFPRQDLYIAIYVFVSLIPGATRHRNDVDSEWRPSVSSAKETKSKRINANVPSNSGITTRAAAKASAKPKNSDY